MAASLIAVDDDPLVRQFLGRILSRERIAGTLLADGEGLLDRVGELSPRGVLLDVEIGRWDGIELAEDVRRRFPAVRVAIMTGNPDAAERARRLGFAPVFDKPLDLEELRYWFRSLTESR